MGGNSDYQPRFGAELNRQLSQTSVTIGANLGEGLTMEQAQEKIT